MELVESQLLQIWSDPPVGNKNSKQIDIQKVSSNSIIKKLFSGYNNFLTILQISHTSDWTIYVVSQAQKVVQFRTLNLKNHCNSNDK